MNDGDICRVQCKSGYTSVGFFACVAQGEILGEAGCVLTGSASIYPFMVAGRLQCQLDATANSAEALGSIFKAALSAALQVSIDAVLRVLVSNSSGADTNQTRRLQIAEAEHIEENRLLQSLERAHQTRQLHDHGSEMSRRLVTSTYAITYELGTNSSANAEKLAQLATNLAAGGSVVQQLLVQVLKDNHNVDVQKIDVLMAPRIFAGGPAPSPAAPIVPLPEAETDMVLIGVAIGLGVLCFILGVVCMLAIRRIKKLIKAHNES